MSAEDERASRPRGAASPPAVPSTSSSSWPRDWARPEDADARSPRSRERLARAKAEVAAIAARVRGHVPSSADGDALAPGDRRAAAALDASGARVYDRDRLGSHGTLSRRGPSWWFFDTHPDFVRETLARDGAVMRCPHLVGNRPTRAPHAIVTERRAKDVRARGGFLGCDTNPSEKRDVPSLRRTAHCCECWERLEFKRLRAAVTCHACGESFPKSKTEPFPLLCDPKVATTFKRDSSAAATARAAAVVDVCFLCAREWKDTRHLEDQKAKHLSALASNHVASDAASRAFAELPIEARVALLESRVRSVGAEKTRNPGKSSERSGPEASALVTTTGDEAVDSGDTAEISAAAAKAAESLTADLRRRMEAVDRNKRRAADASPDAPRVGGFDDDDDDEATDAYYALRKNERTTNDDDEDTDTNGPTLLSAKNEAVSILEALRLRGDDVDAAMRDTKNARGKNVAEAFLSRTVGDDDDAAARANARDKERLDEVMRRDGGSYPLRRSVRFSSSHAESLSEKRTERELVGSGSEKSDAAILPDFYDTAQRREAALLERAKNRDAVSAAVSMEEETTRLAEEARERDLRASEEAKRRKRELEREKLEKWATKGVDLAEYKNYAVREKEKGESSSKSSLQLVVGGVAASGATDGEHNVGEDETKKEDDSRDASVERADLPAPERALSPPPTTEAAISNIGDFQSTPRLSPVVETDSRPIASGDDDIRAEHPAVQSIAIRAASIVQTVAAPIIETVLARVFLSAREPKSASAARTNADASSSPRKKENNSDATAKRTKHRRRAAFSVDVLAVADSGHALPSHPRAPPGSGFAAAWTGAAARRRRRLRNVKRFSSREDDFQENDAHSASAKDEESADFGKAFVHNAHHGRAHEPFDETDCAGVPIPLRDALRVAAELPSALSPVKSPWSDDPEALLRRAEREAAGGAYGHLVASDASTPVDVLTTPNGVPHEDALNEDETARTAYETARARREENTRREHVRLRGVALGIPTGGGSTDDVKDSANSVTVSNPKAMHAAALSLGRVIVPLARRTDARDGGSDGEGEESRGAVVLADSFATVSDSSADATPVGSPGVGGASVPGTHKKRTRRLSASTASALVAEAASRAKAAVADALGVNLYERKARVFGLGLPVSADLENALMSPAEREADFLQRTRKRDKAIRLREAIRLRGKALLLSDTKDEDSNDAFVEGRGVCAVDVATRAPALGFKTSRVRTPPGADAKRLDDADVDDDDASGRKKKSQSRTFLEKERSYHQEQFGLGSEPPKEPSALALAARRGALGGSLRFEHRIEDPKAEAEDRSVSVTRPVMSVRDSRPIPEDTSPRLHRLTHAKGTHAKHEEKRALRRVVSASDVTDKETSVFLDLEDVFENGAAAEKDPSATLLVKAAAKLQALADVHKLKLDLERPFNERHLRAEESSPETERRGAEATNEHFDSDDSDAAYQRLATPFDSDGVPTPTLLDLDDEGTNHRGPATPETEPPTESDEEDDWVNIAYTNRFVDESGRSLRLYDDDLSDVSSGGEDANETGPDESIAASNGVDESVARSVGRASPSNVSATTSDERSRVADDVRSVAASPSSSAGVSSPEPSNRRSAADDYEARVARVAAVADRVSEAARIETRAALGRLGRKRALSSVGREMDPETDSARDANQGSKEQKRYRSGGFFVSVSFFFPSVPYADVATPHARGRVERFVGREIKRAVVAAVAGTIRIAEEDVEVVGMSRGPPPAVAAATEADAASRRFGKEDVDVLDEEITRNHGIAGRDASASERARALAVHCAVRVPDGAAFGTTASTSLRRLKNTRASRTPESNRRSMFREPRDDEDARAARRAAAKARWDRLRETGVALTNVSSRPVRGVGLAEVAVTGSGTFRDLPPPPSPPPLVDLFGGDEAAAEAFREEKFRRDVRDAEDDIEFPDDDAVSAEGDAHPRGEAGLSMTMNDENEKRATFWSYDKLDAMFAKPPLAMDQVPPHERPLTRSPLERLAIVADAHARRLAPSENTRNVFDEIRDANSDPVLVRERQKAEADARIVGLTSRRAKANRAPYDGGIDHVSETANVVPASSARTAERRRRLSPTRFADVSFADADAYVNPRLLRLAARGRGEAAFRTPGEAYANPRLERLKAGKSREAVNAEGDRTS